MAMLSFGGSYIGFLSAREYLSFPDSLIYSTALVSLVFSFVIMLPMILSGVYIFFKGEVVREKYQNIFFKIMIISVVTSIVYGFSFKVFYISALDVRGYYRCAGIPSGWMPGMATKYVKLLAECN